MKWKREEREKIKKGDREERKKKGKRERQRRREICWDGYRERSTK